VVAGSICAARHAGTPHAIAETPASSTTPRYVAGSSPEN
jgi:hypothetical protein